VFEFLVEIYAPYETPSAAARRVEDVSLAAEKVSETGADVRLQRAIFVPEDDIAFYLFESSSADAVREVMTRAGLRFDRITEAISTTPIQRFLEEGDTNGTRLQRGAPQHTHRQSRAQQARSAEPPHACRPAAERTGSNSDADRPTLRALGSGPRRAPALHMAWADPVANH
jgi:hypothetical protein